MPYCPKCHDEFQDWVEICPDCGVALVEELHHPLQETKIKDPLVYIATAPNEIIAKMWAGILEEQGIHCALNTGSSGSAAYGQIFHVPVTIHVIVREAERAKKILDSFSDT